MITIELWFYYLVYDVANLIIALGNSRLNQNCLSCIVVYYPEKSLLVLVVLGYVSKT